jgi:nicotinate phosphoribosyltransferase
MDAEHTCSALITDLYELTMAAAYWEHDMRARATFSLYLRHRPERGYFVAAGLEPALKILQGLRFHDEDIRYLTRTGLFTSPFLEYLRTLRFSGEVRALPEGTLFFADEPILEVTAPMIEAQLLETILINTIGLHTLLATKAARCISVARGRTLVDFALRRTQGIDAGMALARSTYLAGFDGTSNVAAAKRYNIPAVGTMAHSFIQAFRDETAAFEAYARSYPGRTVLLIDTYDTLQGARHAVQVARRMAAAGHALIGVRLDSGDIIAMSREVRRIFDAAGLPQVKIFASGGFDEYEVSRAIEQGAAIDAFGIGTKVGVSADLPYLDMVYKLVRYNARDVRKLSTGKENLAGEKQVFRCSGTEGTYVEDIVALRTEVLDAAEALLVTVMRDGRPVGPSPTLDQIRRDFSARFSRLDGGYKDLCHPRRYPVKLSRALSALQKQAE